MCIRDRHDIENDVNTLHSAAYDPLGLETDVTLDSKGRHKMRSGADDHLYNPATIHLLQQSTPVSYTHLDVYKRQYIDYAMSVIIARALPDVRDGLKPVSYTHLDVYKRHGIYYG